MLRLGGPTLWYPTLGNSLRELPCGTPLDPRWWTPLTDSPSETSIRGYPLGYPPLFCCGGYPVMAPTILDQRGVPLEMVRPNLVPHVRPPRWVPGVVPTKRFRRGRPLEGGPPKGAPSVGPPSVVTQLGHPRHVFQRRPPSSVRQADSRRFSQGVFLFVSRSGVPKRVLELGPSMGSPRGLPHVFPKRRPKVVPQGGPSKGGPPSGFPKAVTQVFPRCGSTKFGVPRHVLHGWSV